MINVFSNHTLVFEGRNYRCALGYAGILPAAQKREGDGATPAGIYPIREIWFRDDRITLPPLNFPVREITPTDGWCDDPAYPQYNRYVKLPFGASHEILWRADQRYDILVVLGYNDHPPAPNRGSCIFWHVSQPVEGGTKGEPNHAPTQGCVAMAVDDLLHILSQLSADAQMQIHAEVSR